MKEENLKKVHELYDLWLANATEDKDLIEELESIKGDDEAINDRFYRDLEFGTGGLRGVIGAGSYRLNIYTIRRATQGLADYVNGEHYKLAVIDRANTLVVDTSEISVESKNHKGKLPKGKKGGIVVEKIVRFKS